MDPATAAAIIKAVIEAIKAKQEADNFANWQEDVTSKLNSILENTNEILAEIRRLRVEFRDALDAAFRTEFINRLQAEILNLEAIMAGVGAGQVLDDYTKKRIREAAERIRLILYPTLSYGFGVVPLALTGIAVLFPALRLVGVEAKEVATSWAQLREGIIKRCLDINIPGSYAFALQASRTMAVQHRASLSTIVGPVTVGYAAAIDGIDTNPYLGPHTYRVVIFTTTIAGDPNVPDSFSSTPLEETLFGEKTHALVAYNYITGNPQPPLDEDKVWGNTRLASEAVRNRLVERAKALSQEMLAEESKAKLLEDFIDQLASLNP